MKYIIAILAITVGIFLVIKTEWFIENFGRSAWAEEKLGGGTRLLYKLIGIAVIILKLMVLTGGFERIFLNIFGGLFGG